MRLAQVSFLPAIGYVYALRAISAQGKQVKTEVMGHNLPFFSLSPFLPLPSSLLSPLSSSSLLSSLLLPLSPLPSCLSSLFFHLSSFLSPLSSFLSPLSSLLSSPSLSPLLLSPLSQGNTINRYTSMYKNKLLFKINTCTTHLHTPITKQKQRGQAPPNSF